MPSFRICPECSERLSHDARQCVCGWRDPAYFGGGKAHDPMHGKCSYLDGNDRCRFPGSVSHGLKGDGKWLCAFHFFDGGGVHGARIVQSSFDWDGTADSYLRMRAEHQARQNSGAEAKAQGGGESRGIPKAIRELVQNLRVQKEAA